MQQAFQSNGHIQPQFLEAYANAIGRKDGDSVAKLFTQAKAEQSHILKRHADLQKLSSRKSRRPALYPMYYAAIAKQENTGYGAWAITEMDKRLDGVIPTRQEYDKYVAETCRLNNANQILCCP